MGSKAFFKKRRTRPSMGEGHGIISASGIGAGVGGVCAVALLVVATLICTFSDDPDSIIAPIGMIISVISYFIAGFAASKKRRAAIPVGALSGVMLTAAFIIISLFVDKTLSWELSLTVALLIRLSFVAVSILGALLGTNAISKRKPRR